MGIVCAMGYFPYLNYHATSIYFHDADYRIFEHGKRKTLMVLPNYQTMVGLNFFNLIW
jgi:hypothetical protein